MVDPEGDKEENQGFMSKEASAIREGRETAIPRLLEEHGSRLYGLATKLCTSREEAEDLVQEVFLQAWRKWDHFEGRGDPMAWLWTIAARACQRLHRRKSGEPEHMVSLDELLPFSGDRMAALDSDPRSPLDEEIMREARENLRVAIARLPMTFRMPLILKDIIGLSVLQISEVLGIKEATVKTRLHRARLRLRQALEQAFPSREAPVPVFSKQVCLDLLRSKQEALDRGVEFPADNVICERCRTVFETLDMTRNVCRDIFRGELPGALRRRLLERIGPGASAD